MKYFTVFCIFLLTPALADHQANHEVRIGIPHILRLKLEKESSTLELPLEIAVSDSSYDISPAEVVLEIFANSDWQLLVRQQPQGEDIQLIWRSRSDWHALDKVDRLMFTGTKTAGWQAHSVHYGLRVLPAAGFYRTTVVYTLTRP